MGSSGGRARRLAALATVALAAFALVACSTTVNPSADLPAQSSGTLPKDTTSQLKSAVTSAMKLAGASGAVVGVWAPWSGSWTAGIGDTATKGGQPMTTNEHFRIASNTKSMTCTVLLALVDRGVVGLDDQVKKYLPRMVGIDGVTLRQLCQNTSGIGDYAPSLDPQFVNNPTRQWAQMELASNGLAQPAVGAPGAKWGYSNTGFILLGMALQAATGKSWDALYQQYVFGPLGMSQTSFPSSGTLALPSPSPAGYATALDPNTGADQCGTVVDDTKQSNSSGWTAGGVVSTLSDMKTYVQALATGALVSKASSEDQWKTVQLSGTAPTWQGYGLGVMQYGPLRGHDGEVPGTISAMMSDPKSGLTVVVMLNNSTSGGNLAQLLGLELSSIASKAAPASGKKAPVIALPWSQDQVAQAMAASAKCQPAPAPGATPPAAPPAADVPQSGD
jgi:D-alanyl-D-alanine carboxypeptidase